MKNSHLYWAILDISSAGPKKLTGNQAVRYIRPFAANSVDLGWVRYFSFSVPKAKRFTMDFYKFMNFVIFQ